MAFFALVFGRNEKKVPVVVEVRDLWPESIVEYKRMSRKNSGYSGVVPVGKVDL